MNKIRGIIPPLSTPLSGPDSLDLSGLQRLVDHVIDGGVAAVFILGSTGEAPSLSQRLRHEFVTAAARAIGGRVPLLVGISDTSLVDSLALAKHARDCGAVAAVAAAPYYYPMSQADLATHFVQLGERCPLPLFLYNMPICVKSMIEPATYERCAAVPNIVGVKDSCGDFAAFERLLRVRAAHRPDWLLYIGPERLTAQATLAGGDGGVNGGSNVAPRLLVEVFNAADRKDHAALEPLLKKLAYFGKIYEAGDDYMKVARGVKCAVSHLDLCSDQMAPPFHPYDERRRAKIRGVLEHLELIRR